MLTLIVQNLSKRKVAKMLKKDNKNVEKIKKMLKKLFSAENFLGKTAQYRGIRTFSVVCKLH